MTAKTNSYGFFGGFFRLLGWLVKQWKLVLIAAFFLSPYGPHLRYEYTYREAYGHRAYLSCTYLGSRGFVTPAYVEGCPIFIMLDASDWKA